MESATPTDPYAIALSALTATLAESRRAQRFLDLTGIVPADLRTHAADRRLLLALITFLENHEPDLLAVAQEMGIGPNQIIAARRAIEGES